MTDNNLSKLTKFTDRSQSIIYAAMSESFAMPYYKAKGLLPPSEAQTEEARHKGMCQI